MNPFRFFDLICCINLNSRPDRWEKAWKEFQGMGIEYEVVRIEGIKHVNPALGCHLSHARCIQKAIDINAKNILIFEDDIEFFTNAYENLIQSLVELPLDWDMFYLGANLDAYPARQISDHIISITGAFSTHAYSFTNKLFNLLKEINEDFSIAHNDVYYANNIHSQYNSYLAYPLIAGQREDFSDVQRTVMKSNPIFLERVEKNTLWELKR